MYFELTTDYFLKLSMVSWCPSMLFFCCCFYSSSIVGIIIHRQCRFEEKIRPCGWVDDGCFLRSSIKKRKRNDRVVNTAKAKRMVPRGSKRSCCRFSAVSDKIELVFSPVKWSSISDSAFSKLIRAHMCKLLLYAVQCSS